MTGESWERRVGVTCAQAALRPGDAATSTRSISATTQAHGRARSLSVNRLAPRVGRKCELLSVRVRPWGARVGLEREGVNGFEYCEWLRTDQDSNMLSG